MMDWYRNAFSENTKLNRQQEPTYGFSTQKRLSHRRISPSSQKILSVFFSEESPVTKEHVSARNPLFDPVTDVNMFPYALGLYANSLLARPDASERGRGVKPMVASGLRRPAWTMKNPILVQNLVKSPNSQARGAYRVVVHAASAQGTPSKRPVTAPKRVAILVEPSPFTYVSGYKNRFCNTIKYLVEAGCEVMVVTTGNGVAWPGTDDPSALQDAPTDYYGAEVVSSYSFGFPFYPRLPLTFGLSPRIYKKIADFKPDIIHCSSPGFLVFAAWLYSKMLSVPLVLSYHTHLPKYAPDYNVPFLVPFIWGLIRLTHAAAQLTLLTSSRLRQTFLQEKAAPEDALHVWNKGVDTDVFHPQFRSDSMRYRLTEGHPEDPVMIYVGRLGNEKNLKFLKEILARVPNLRLALVGDGPSRAELETYFIGTKTIFLGMLHGEDLSAAYASADVFVMPSESETLGFVVMEAMSSQVPVVAVKAGGIPDIIDTERKGGFLYESGDVGKATELILSLVKNPSFREEMGKEARLQVRQWDWRAATMHLLSEQYPIAIERFNQQQEHRQQSMAVEAKPYSGIA